MTGPREALPLPAPPDGSELGGASPWQRRVPAALFAGSFALRALHVFAERSSPLFGGDLPPWDAYYYTQAAWALASGQGWTPELAYVSSPPYALFLTGCFALFGRDVLGVRLVQAALGALTPVLLQRIGTRVFDARVGVVAGVLAALYGPFVFYEGELLKPWAAVLASSAALALLIDAAPRARALRLLGAGALLGLLVQLRGNLVLFAPCALAWVAWSAGQQGRRAALRATAALIAGLVLVQAPYLARGLFLEEGRAAFSEGAGLHFYIGNHSGATGTYAAVPGIRATAEGHAVDAARVAAYRLQRPLSAREVSRYWLGQGLSWIAAEPGAFARLALRKLELFVNAYEIPSNEDLYLTRQFSWVLRLPLVSFGVICPLALLGVALRLRERRAEEMLLLAFLACSALSLLALFVTSHYRLVAVPVLIVFAAHAGVWLAERVRDRRGRALAPALAGLALAALAVHGPEPLSREDYSRKAQAQLRAALGEFALADAGRVIAQRAWLEAQRLVRAGRFEAAIPLLERALAAAPASKRLQGELEAAREGAAFHTPAGVGAIAAIAPPPSETLVLVVVDTLRADHLGCYGYAWDTAPAICRLAGTGTLFERAYTPRTETTPALASLFTGLPPHRHGVENLYQVLPDAARTLAEQLQEAGYETGAFVSSFAMVRDFSGLQQGFDVYDDALTRLEPFRESFERGAAQTVDAAIGWLRRAGPRAFLFVHLIEPHGPYTPSEEVHRRFARPASGPVVAAAPEYQRIAGIQKLSEYVSRYDAEIATADAEVGRLLAALAELGRERAATIAVTADHGESFGEEGQWLRHGRSLNDAEAHVPLILRFAGGVPPARHAGAVALSDLYATFLAAAGVEVAQDVAGASVDLRGVAQSGRRSGSPPMTWLPREDGSTLVVHGSGCAPRWAISGRPGSRLDPGGSLQRVAGAQPAECAGSLEASARLFAQDLLEFQRPFAVTWRRDAFEPGVRTRFLQERGDLVVPLSSAERQKLRSLGYIE